MPIPASIDVRLPAHVHPANPLRADADVTRDRLVAAAVALARPELEFDPTAESVVAEYFSALGAPGLRGVAAAVRHPGRTAAMLAALRRLPLLHARPTPAREGHIVRIGLLRQQRLVRAAVRGLTAVLVLPDQAGEYLLTPGKSRKGVRNRVKSAERAGITWRAIDDPAERQRLVGLADAFERANPREVYRHEDADNADLLDVDLWLLASAADGTPLLLAVLAIDGEWAVQRYFRTVTHSEEASLSRWLMADVAVEALVARGVRYLADTSSPITLEPGLRYFQRLVGFRLYRVRVGR